MCKEDRERARLDLEDFLPGAGGSLRVLLLAVTIAIKVKVCHPLVSLPAGQQVSSVVVP